MYSSLFQNSHNEVFFADFFKILPKTRLNTKLFVNNYDSIIILILTPDLIHSIKTIIVVRRGDYAETCSQDWKFQIRQM